VSDSLSRVTETTPTTVRVPVPDSVTGLTRGEVEARIAAGETNAVVEVTSRPLSEIIRANVFTRFNALLGALLVLVLSTGSYKNALFGIALVVNSLLGIGQEWHAKRNWTRSRSFTPRRPWSFATEPVTRSRARTWSAVTSSRCIPATR